MKKIITMITLMMCSVFTFGQNKNGHWDSILMSDNTYYKHFINNLSGKEKEDSINQFKLNPCNLNRIIDEFTGDVTYYVNSDVSFTKVISKGISKLYLSIWIKEDDIYTGKGVILILENGKKINKPNENVEYTYSSGSFYATTFIQLTNQDILLLKESGISKFKLYILDGYTNFSKETCEQFNCLIKSK